MVAVDVAVTADAVAVKVELVLLAGTVTVAGTVTALLLSDTVTAAPPVGAAAVRVIVQVLEPAPVNVPGLQLKVDKAAVTGTGLRVREAVLETLL
jgi:hypothetical protein